MEATGFHEIPRPFKEFLSLAEPYMQARPTNERWSVRLPLNDSLAQSASALRGHYDVPDEEVNLQRVNDQMGIVTWTRAFVEKYSPRS